MADISQPPARRTFKIAGYDRIIHQQVYFTRSGQPFNPFGVGAADLLIIRPSGVKYVECKSCPSTGFNMETKWTADQRQWAAKAVEDGYEYWLFLEFKDNKGDNEYLCYLFSYQTAVSFGKIVHAADIDERHRLVNVGRGEKRYYIIPDTHQFVGG